jgi:pentatricopeptide repeat protein
VIRACNLAGDVEFGEQIHGQVLKHCLKGDDFVASALIDLHLNSGCMEDGFRCFRSLPKQDVVTGTAMISGCVQNELFERALTLFHELLGAGLKPDPSTITSVMNACASLAVARTGLVSRFNALLQNLVLVDSLPWGIPVYICMLGQGM